MIPKINRPQSRTSKMIEITSYASSSKGNAYLITDGRFPLLLEVGIPWKIIRQKMNFQTSSLAGCLITHSHNDHAGYIKEAIKAGIDCCLSKETAEAKQVGGHRVKIIEPLKQFVVGSWTILPFPTEHDCPGSLGFLLANQSNEKLLFITDSFYCKYLFKGLTHIMLECNHSTEILRQNVESDLLAREQKNRLMRSHFSLENVKKFLQANDLSKVQEIHLLHLSDANSDAEYFKREIEKLTGKLVIVAES